MICYKDKTFCGSDCKNTLCHRNITPEVIAGGTAWWGSDDFPMATSDFSKHCDSYQPSVRKSKNDC